MGIKKLDSQLQILVQYIEAGDKKNTAVSQAGTYWHVEHCLKILDGIVTVLEKSSPADYKPKFSFLKFFIMNTGYIPRGKARAPKETVPESVSSKSTLIAMQEQVRLQLLKINALPANSCFKHPFFGWLNKKETVKFMGIHTKHHLKIMSDIKG
ncbi:MAG: hypothetical protein NWQ09_03865 [Nonlabens sp.]|nr:hypothetical protein [Nonlabens sp.]